MVWNVDKHPIVRLKILISFFANLIILRLISVPLDDKKCNSIYLSVASRWCCPCMIMLLTVKVPVTKSQSFKLVILCMKKLSACLTPSPHRGPVIHIVLSWDFLIMSWGHASCSRRLSDLIWYLWGNTAGLMEECAILADDTTVTDWKLRIDNIIPTLSSLVATVDIRKTFESSIHDVSFVINGSTRGCRQSNNARSSYLRHG